MELTHASAFQSGISGVPVLVFGEDHVIAGAQPVEAVAALLDLERYRWQQGRNLPVTDATVRSHR